MLWSSAGLVAVHSHAESIYGCVALCSVVGNEQPALQLLHLLSSGACVSNLSFNSTGLLLAFADHGRWGRSHELISQHDHEQYVQVAGQRSQVIVCAALSGKAAIVADHGRQGVIWQPARRLAPRALSNELGLMCAWYPDSTSLVIAGPARETHETRGHLTGRRYILKQWRVVQLLFAPSAHQSLWQRLPPLIVLYDATRPLWPWSAAFVAGWRWQLARWVVSFLAYFLPWLSPVSRLMYQLPCRWVAALWAAVLLLRAALLQTRLPAVASGD